MRETEDMIAVREVQGLMDNIGEPPALQPQACPQAGKFPDGRVCHGSPSGAPSALTGVLCPVSQRMSSGNSPQERQPVAAAWWAIPRKDRAHCWV